MPRSNEKKKSRFSKINMAILVVTFVAGVLFEVKSALEKEEMVSEKFRLAFSITNGVLVHIATLLEACQMVMKNTKNRMKLKLNVDDEGKLELDMSSGDDDDEDEDSVIERIKEISVQPPSSRPSLMMRSSFDNSISNESHVQFTGNSIQLIKPTIKLVAPPSPRSHLADHVDMFAESLQNSENDEIPSCSNI